MQIPPTISIKMRNFFVFVTNDYSVYLCASGRVNIMIVSGASAPKSRPIIKVMRLWHQPRLVWERPCSRMSQRTERNRVEISAMLVVSIQTVVKFIK